MCLEIAIPILFVVGIIGIWAAVGNSTYSAKQFVNYTKPLPNITNFTRLMSCINSSTITVPTINRCPPVLPPGSYCTTPQMGVPLPMCFLAPPFLTIGFYGDFENYRDVISLDDYLIMRWAVFAAGIVDLNRDDYFTTLRQFGVLGQFRFAPDTAETRGLVAHLNRTSALFPYVYGGIWSTEQQLTDYVVTVNAERNGGGTMAMIVVNKMNVNAFDVKLRFNASLQYWTSEVALQFYSGGLGNTPLFPQTYFPCGFLTVQKAVNDYYVEFVLNQTPVTKPTLAPMPYPSYTEWIFLQVGASQGYFSLFMVLSFLYPVSQLVKSIVKEKEARIREAMMIMGLGTGSFYVSWFITYAIQFGFTSIVSAVLMRLTFFPNNDFGAVFFLLFLFSLSTISLAGVLSTFFSKARVSALVSPIVYFILSIPLFLVDNMSVQVRGIFLLLSPSCVTEGFTLLAQHEQAGGMRAADVASARDDINMLTVLIMLGIDTILYALITLYLDAVFPSEWGTRRHPCFCILDPIRWCRSSGNTENAEDGRDPNGFFEPEDNNSNPIKVEFKGLRKVFERGDGEFVAVNNLHMHLRENEVTVLLGHNGAGKTTTINLVTGMLEIDEGDCIMYGTSVRKDLAAARRDIAFCPQHNILWPELTCIQHLRFYAGLKGVTGDACDAAIDEMLKAVDLYELRNNYATQLSGGQMRKLSVAIAFVGGSRFVILDEPTAGMDVAARRHTWDLIKRMAPGRCILLTTHFMDEADLLGDKISIMSKGCLKTEGTSGFLKQQFSVGYTLNLSVDKGANTDPARDMIMQTVPHAKQLPTGGEEVAFRVPMSAAKDFPAILGYLEDHGEEQGIRGFGVNVTTLEDVFIRIAHEEETGSPASTLSATSRGGHGFDDHPSNKSHAPNDTTVVPMGEASGGRHWTTRATDEERSLGRQLTAVCMKRFHNIKRDRRTQCLQILMPVGCILLSMLLLLIEIVPIQPELIMNAGMYESAGIKNQDVILSNCPFTNANLHPLYTPVVVNTPNASATSQYLLDNFQRHGNDRFLALHCDDAPSQSTLIMTNYSAYHAMAEGVHLYYQGAIRSRNATLATVPFVLRNHPMPWTDRESALISAIRTFLVGIVILIPFTFIPSTFVGWVVKEKECKAKHLQFVSGLNFFVYWLGNLIFDTLSFLVTEFLVIIIFLAFSRAEYIGSGETFGATFLLFLFYGLSGAAMSYVLAFFFQEHSGAQNVVMMGNFICGFLLVFMVFMFQLFDSTKRAGEVLSFIFRLVPSFCLGDGIINLASLDFARAFGVTDSPFEWKRAGYDILYMAIEFPVFFCIAMLLDHPARQRNEQMLLHDPSVIPPPIEDEDEDVKAERRRIEEPEAGQNPCLQWESNAVPAYASDPHGPDSVDDVVVVRHLNKKYSTGKVAVRNLSLGVKRGEVFGFLGTNGAGKTTSISILCGEQLPTHGYGFVAGYDVVQDALKAQQHIGYCPQFDALLELLTAKEHLQLYAGLRGVPSNVTDMICDELIEVCGLTEHKDTLAGSMSGGNKRKLSVAISLIGGPSVVFLDEPSAGMDPVARRGLWEVIDDIARHSSVVLTTHHLEEVEALAHRVAIMVDGRLMCIGDKTHLKNKYGDGFEMHVRVQDAAHAEAFEAFVAERFPTAEQHECRNHRYTYAVPSSSIKLSQLFALLEEKSEELGISNYSVSDTSIESVFLRISAGAEADANEVAHNADAAQMH